MEVTPFSKQFPTQNLSSVEDMNGFAGHITTNQTYGNKLHFGFFPAKNNHWAAPLLLFLPGGPGVSYMFTMINGIGPFDDGLKLREHPWNLNHNLLLIDQPVGTGFSFSEKGKYPESGAEVAEELYSGIVTFLNFFSQYQNNEFYIAGESYAGHYIPQLGHTIHKKNACEDLKINLKGMMIGNGWMDPKTQIHYSDYLYHEKLIDHKQHSVIKQYEGDFLRKYESKDWSAAYEWLNTIHELIKEYTGRSLYDMRRPVNGGQWEISNWLQLVQTKDFRRAAHVEDSQVFNEWSEDVHNHLKRDMVQSVKPLVEELLEAGYRFMFYTGELDIICAHPMVEDFLKSLEYTGKQRYQEASWNDWYETNDKVGWWKIGGNLCNVLVSQAGHAAAVDQPFRVFKLLNHFTSNN